MQEKLNGILSKAIKSRKREIVVAENIFGNTLFLTVSDAEKIYAISYELSKFQFQKKYHEALKISTAELERLEKNLSPTFNIDFNVDHKEAMERLIAEHMMASDEIITKYGASAEVIAQEQLTAIKVIILYYPEYLIVKSNYLPIRGGNKLFEEVTIRTKEQFENVVPGRWKWNLGNWRSKQGLASAALAQVEITKPSIVEDLGEQPSISGKTSIDPLKRREMERDQTHKNYRAEMDMMRTLEAKRLEALDQNAFIPSNNDASTAEYDDYFN